MKRLIIITLLVLAFVPTASAADQKFKRYVEQRFPACAWIIDKESVHTWDPTIDYGMGHGNVNESYGIGQANPGTKMAPFGADWRTNVWTQWRWMRSYVLGRFHDHGDCINAKIYWINNNSY